MTVAVFPGSFDPFTLGHIQLCQRLNMLFSEVVVLVAHNQDKQYLFSVAERTEIVHKTLQEYGLTQVKVRQTSELLVDYLSQNYAHQTVVLVKGVRGAIDADNEVAMAHMNYHLGKIDTLLMPTGNQVSYISSSFVKDVAKHKGQLTGLTGTAVANALKAKLGS